MPAPAMNIARRPSRQARGAFMANYEIINGSRRPTMSHRVLLAVEMLDPSVHAALAAILPPPALLTASEDTKPYECDGLMLYREQPAAVLLPENEAQVVAILRCCFAAGIAVVARGAGTSLSGGALP